jgi:tRNA(fMet)-specific endonuclease VapC
MRLLLDTNRYADFVRGAADVLELLADADVVFVPFIVLGELHFGFRHGSRRVENERRLEQFLDRPNVRTLYADYQTVDVYAQLAVQLAKQGTPIPTNDIWIAAIALQHALTLYARDAHFDHLPQLARI